LPAESKPPQIRVVKHTLGRGVRYAIDAGMRAAIAPVVVVMMADVSDDFEKVGEMVRRAEAGADVVAASRYMRGGKQIGGPKLKGFLSRTAGVTLYHFAGVPAHDPPIASRRIAKSSSSAPPSGAPPASSSRWS
jgi:hypothetical protein